MAFLIYNKKLNKVEKVSKSYPHIDINEPLAKMDYSLHGVYFIKYKMPDDKNPLQYDFIQSDYELTDEKYNGLDHILIAYKVYQAVEKEKETVIENLKASCGTHLDVNYPLWKRFAHQKEKEKTTDKARKAYIEQAQVWEVKCRQDLNQRITDYIDNNVFPSFEWDAYPTEDGISVNKTLKKDY